MQVWFRTAWAPGQATVQSAIRTRLDPVTVIAPFSAGSPPGDGVPPSTRTFRTSISWQVSKTSAASWPLARMIEAGPAPLTTMRERALIAGQRLPA